jgi:hypothetical protein
MMATSDTGTRVNGEIPGRKDLRPAPCLGGMGVFPGQRLGQVDFAMPLSQVLLMPRLDPSMVQTEHLSHVIEECGLLTSRHVRHIWSPS